ncbi:uncharacterized protein LOC116845932 [Odontomachus brunneus]|uniref:uncharacterized protein LOC116845932 n=1 Tax=Odontomachus brunneus TaxID=486640 RepID=UPI0013F2773D|nr:uncharacterized protein LOC116845932 [Odontomachus brunneus]
MEFLEEYYKFNRILLSVTGLWPYDNIKVRQLRFILLLLILLSLMSAQLLKLFVSKYQPDIVLKVLCFNIVIVIMTLKYITFYAIADKVKIFRKYLLDNWSNLTDNQEIQIIYKQAKIAKTYTIFITTFVYFIICSCIIVQYLPNLFDIIRPLNVSRSRQEIILVEYFIDQQKYFHIITMNINIALFTVGTTGLATETFLLANALCACGMFQIASYRMKNILNGNELQICATKKYTAFRDRIIAAVDIHKRAIQYCELLNKNFGFIYLFSFLGVVISTSINLFYVLRIIPTKNILDIVLHILLIILHLMALIIANYAGQQCINCDSHVYRTICNTRWYNAPLKTQKLILFLIQKTTKCYKINAGGMFSPSFEGLATVRNSEIDINTIIKQLKNPFFQGLSMSVSYFMVLYSI